MFDESLDRIPLWLFDFGVCALLFAAMELGFRMGQRRSGGDRPEREAPVGAMVASTLGLLALLLGFTFSFAASRFDARRTVILEEANAIGTTFLRTQMLPDAQRIPSEKLLKEYVEARIRGANIDQVHQSIARSEEIQQELWKHAVSVGAQPSPSITTGLYIQSLNELIDLHEMRLQAAGRSRIPSALWLALIALMAMGIASVGYLSGLSKSRRSPVMIAMIVSLTIVLALIADLDRADQGLLRVTKGPLIDTQKMIDSMLP